MLSYIDIFFLNFYSKNEDLKVLICVKIVFLFVFNTKIYDTRYA